MRSHAFLKVAPANLAEAPDEIRNSPSPEVQQFINGHPDGPIPLKLAKEDYIDRLIGNPHEGEK